MNRTFQLEPLEARGETRPESWRIEVPVFPAGPYPPPAAECYPLRGRSNPGAGLGAPVYIPEALLEDLIANEARYRKWVPRFQERAFFLVGRLFRAPDHKLWMSLAKMLEARELSATSASFEFSGRTWLELRRALSPGEILLGWLHTHSLAALSEELAPAAKTGNGNGAGPDVSALFISLTDLATARAAWNAPWHLTAVLDSDAAQRAAGGEVGREKVLGVWSWSYGLLLPKDDVYMVKAVNTTCDESNRLD